MITREEMLARKDEWLARKDELKDRFVENVDDPDSRRGNRAVARGRGPGDCHSQPHPRQARRLGVPVARGVHPRWNRGHQRRCGQPSVRSHLDGRGGRPRAARQPRSRSLGPRCSRAWRARRSRRLSTTARTSGRGWLLLGRLTGCFCANSGPDHAAAVRSYGVRRADYHTPWDPTRPGDFWELPVVAERLRAQIERSRGRATRCVSVCR